MRKSRSIWSKTLVLLSGEFLLTNTPNGGAVILGRAAWVSILIYLPSIGIKSRLAPGTTWAVSVDELRILLAETLPWFGAIFAAVYLALYARFSSQWSYLADLYNQIMQVQVQGNHSDSLTRADSPLSKWMAGFVEDADDLHLALKPSYAYVIVSLLRHQGVREAYKAHTFDGQKKLEKLEQRLSTVVELERANT